MENKLVVHRNFPDDATVNIKHLLRDVYEVNTSTQLDLGKKADFEQWVEEQAALADDMLDTLAANGTDALDVPDDSEGEEPALAGDSDSDFD